MNAFVPPCVPYVIAHRAANTLEELRAAEHAGFTVVEADVRLFHGRLEVRHLKSVGPVPILWDRWTLANPFAHRLTLRELLPALSPDTNILFDLKGFDPRLATLLAAELDRHPQLERRASVCSRNWRLLQPFADRSHVVRSIRTERGIATLDRRVRRGAHRGSVSIHESLLDEGRVEWLLERADSVMTWPVNSAHRAFELAGWGVTGLISDAPDLIATAIA